MSADNRIYIGVFPLIDKSGAAVVEYRVIHAQNIEDCDWGMPEVQDNTRALFYGDAKSFATLDEARKEAFRLYADLDICGCILDYDRPLIKKTAKEAREWLDKLKYFRTVL